MESGYTQYCFETPESLRNNSLRLHDPIKQFDQNKFCPSTHLELLESAECMVQSADLLIPK